MTEFLLENWDQICVIAIGSVVLIVLLGMGLVAADVIKTNRKRAKELTPKEIEKLRKKFPKIPEE